MAHSTTSNSSSTRRSLRLITAERKSSVIDPTDDDPSNEQSSSSSTTRTHSHKRSHSKTSSSKSRKRARQSSSSDDEFSRRTRSRSRRNVCPNGNRPVVVPPTPPVPPPPPPPPPTTTTDASLFGRVQHLMNRVGCHSISHRVDEFVRGLRSTDGDLRLSTLNDLCSFLVLNNEETLPAFQYRLVYPLLRDCLVDPDDRHGEIVLTACRALTYLMEALPRSIGLVVGSTSILLGKLRRITSIDIAEQTLIALEMISKRNGKEILMSDGISACLEFFDFFSLNSQNKSLSIVSNCCFYLLNREDFPFIRRHLDQLVQRLKSDEKKTIEYLCQIFSRLIENFHRDALILRELAEENLLRSFVELLRRSNRNFVSTSTFCRIVRILSNLTRNCPSIVSILFELNFVETFVDLLVQRTSSSGEIFQIVSFIGEILPRLPVDDPLFLVENVRWHWLDETSQLRPFSIDECRTIENAWQQNEDEIQLNIDHRISFVDFQEINDETNQIRSIKRLVTSNENCPSTFVSTEIDPRNLLVEEISNFIRKLYPILYEICQTSAGPTVTHRAFQSLLRMISSADDELLRELVCEKSISSQISSMLASKSSKLVVIALQMSEILLKKLPKIFDVEFVRQGVANQLDELSSRSTERQRTFSQSTQWIESQSKQIRENFTFRTSENLLRLSVAVEKLTKENFRTTLNEIGQIVANDDVSPFEILHSGFIRKLNEFFTDETTNRNEFLKIFLQVFAQIPPIEKKTILNVFISKLHGCVNQLEQLPIRVNDLAGQTSTLRLINSQQLKCHLVRHPSCKKLRSWTHGPVKIDPLALISAIEKYLLVRGIGQSQMDDEDENEIHLDFLINEHLVPHQMTIYQAIHMFNTSSSHQRSTPNEFDDSSTIWSRVHTIFYRQSTRSKSVVSRLRTNKIRSITKAETFLHSILNEKTLKIDDLSSEPIFLLRILHALSFRWFDLIESSTKTSLVDKSEFYSTKLTSKVNRQLQDPLSILMSEIPSWIVDLPHQCRFLFPFETRQMLFYPCAFDRERALQRLLENNDLFHRPDPQDRQTIGPRLERRKVQMSRENLFNEMEKLLDNWNSRQFLEIQYENEVGFGLGPTLEAYALISKDFQKTKNEMWRNDSTDENEFVDQRFGLFPSPIGRNAKTNFVNKIRSKFVFLGKFFAKALMDCRMVDLPLNILFYR